MDVTTPIYCPNERGEPEAIGSGVLLTLGERRFLITAAHVLDGRDGRALLVQGGSSLFGVGGDVVRIEHVAARTVLEDHVDVAAVCLAGENSRQVPHSLFAAWTDLDHSPSRVTRDSFGLTGYLLSQQKNSLKGLLLSASAYRMAALESPPEVYSALKHDPELNLILGFEKRRTWGPEGQHTAPDLYGLSGSGAWRFGPDLHKANTPARLSGIVIECHSKGPHKHILATRIRPIIAALTDRYPDVNRFVRGKLSASYQE